MIGQLTTNERRVAMTILGIVALCGLGVLVGLYLLRRGR